MRKICLPTLGLFLLLLECASMECRILKSQSAKHIDRWQLEFDVDKHLERDSARSWLPEIALSYLRSNYPAEVMEEILAQVAVPERGRQIVLCKSCEPFISNGKMQVTVNDSGPSRTRLCDYAVDPVVAVSAERARERWQDHSGSFEESELANVPSSGYVLGRSVHQFAPDIAALNDGEEMVTTCHGIVSLFGRCCFSAMC